jgi:hypothetical protein
MEQGEVAIHFFWFQASCICLTGAWDRHHGVCKLFMVAFGNEKYFWVYICDIIYICDPFAKKVIEIHENIVKVD